MPARPSPRSFVIEDPGQVKLLSDAKYRSLLMYFMRRPAATKDAARAHDQTVQRTFNAIQRLQGAGLLEICQVTARAGKSVKTYRATAEDDFVPFGLTHADGYAHRLEQKVALLQRALLESLERTLSHRDPFGWGTRLAGLRVPRGLAV
jgi:hypothetical protein